MSYGAVGGGYEGKGETPGGGYQAAPDTTPVDENVEAGSGSSPRGLIVFIAAFLALAGNVLFWISADKALQATVASDENGVYLFCLLIVAVANIAAFVTGSTWVHIFAAGLLFAVADFNTANMRAINDIVMHYGDAVRAAGKGQYQLMLSGFIIAFVGAGLSFAAFPFQNFTLARLTSPYWIAVFICDVLMVVGSALIWSGDSSVGANCAWGSSPISACLVAVYQVLSGVCAFARGSDLALFSVSVSVIMFNPFGQYNGCYSDSMSDTLRAGYIITFVALTLVCILSIVWGWWAVSQRHFENRIFSHRGVISLIGVAACIAGAVLCWACKDSTSDLRVSGDVGFAVALWLISSVVMFSVLFTSSQIASFVALGTAGSALYNTLRIGNSQRPWPFYLIEQADVASGGCLRTGFILLLVGGFLTWAAAPIGQLRPETTRSASRVAAVVAALGTLGAVMFWAANVLYVLPAWVCVAFWVGCAFEWPAGREYAFLAALSQLPATNPFSTGGTYQALIVFIAYLAIVIPRVAGFESVAPSSPPLCANM